MTVIYFSFNIHLSVEIQLLSLIILVICILSLFVFLVYSQRFINYISLRKLYFGFDFSFVQFSRSVLTDSATPWTAACQASLSITNSQSLLKPMSIESVMPSNIKICGMQLKQCSEGNSKPGNAYVRKEDK